MKPEYDPLLPAGIHQMTLAQLKTGFVDKFPGSKRREEIFQHFVDFLRFVTLIDVIEEIWIDGSFVTEKDEPDDIDAFAFASASVVNSLPHDRKNYMRMIFSDPITTKIRFMTDIRFCTIEDQNMRSYWRGWYCFTRDEKPKGAIALKVKGISICILLKNVKNFS